MLYTLAGCQRMNAGILNLVFYALLIWAVDLSSLPEIERSGAVFYSERGKAESVLETIKKNGINGVRLRLWHNPGAGHSGLNEVRAFSARIRSEGLKVWLSIHYSDTWADPLHQEPPEAWKGISYNSLKDSVYSYTKRVVCEVRPDYVEIGNEINSGFLFPLGKIDRNKDRFLELLSVASHAVRDASGDARIVVHYAGIYGAEEFFEMLSGLDYDVIGISFYPLWHGKNLNNLKDILVTLCERFRKGVVIAETAYPFTLGWKDQTRNIVGLESQLILPDFPATPKGQKDFLMSLRRIIESIPCGEGLCYWGAELVAFRGIDSEKGSPWENQALYDFNNRALPAVSVFKDN